MNLLITGAWQQAADYIPALEAAGYKVQFLPFERGRLPCEAAWVEGIIGNGIFLSHPIEQFLNLRYIQLTSAGYDRVPMDYVREHGIEIHNAKGVYSIPMAEFAVAGVLQLYKGMDFFRENQRKHVWNKRRDLLELFGKTICVVGCGSVGTECAKRFQAFGCHVIGVDLFPGKNTDYSRIVGLDQLDESLQEADVLVLTLPLTDKTRHLINADRLKALKFGAILVNIARGAVVDTAALEPAMNRLGGAVLDVFEEEPLDEHSPLWDMENVVITPHNSFVGENDIKRLSEVIFKNLNQRAGN